MTPTHDPTGHEDEREERAREIRSAIPGRFGTIDEWFAASAALPSPPLPCCYGTDGEHRPGCPKREEGP